MMSMKCLAVERQRDRLAQFRIVEGRRIAVGDQAAAGVPAVDPAIDLGRRALDFLHQRRGDEAGPGAVEFLGAERQDPGRCVADDRIFDAVEIRPPLLPIIGVAGQHDPLVRLELDKFERPGADRMLAHLRRRHMARIDRRPARGQQPDKRRLRPLQVKARLEIAVGGHLIEVAPPGFARVDAEFVGGFAGQQVPGAFDVGGGKRLAVMPFDALAQFDGQRRAGLVPAPARRQFRPDRVEAVLRDLLIEHDEVVEHRHHRPFGDDRRFLVDRHAGRAVAVRHTENAAVFLRRRRTRSAQQQQHDGDAARQ